MNAFSARGHHVTILVIRPERKKPTISFFHDQSLDVYEIHPPSFSPFNGKRGIGKYVNYLLCLPGIEKTVSKIMDKNKIDYVYSYMPGIGSSLPAMRIKSKLNIKHVIDFADFDTYVRPKCLVKYSFRNADKIITITEYLSEVLKRRGINSNKISIIPNGVDLQLFDPLKYNTQQILELRKSFNAENIIVFSGALQDLTILIDSAKKIIQNQKNTKFVIIGDHRDPKRSKKIWENKVRQKNLEEYFIFLGRKPREEIPKYLLCADICVDTFPEEPYYAAAHPVKLLEYGACEKPIVATSVHETKKIIKNGIYGFLAVPSNSSEFADNLLKLLESKKLRKDMGKNFSEYVKKNFDWKKIAIDLEIVLCN